MFFNGHMQRFIRHSVLADMVVADEVSTVRFKQGSHGLVKASDAFLVSHLVNSLHRDYGIETAKPCGPSGAFEIDLHLSDSLRE